MLGRLLLVIPCLVLSLTVITLAGFAQEIKPKKTFVEPISGQTIGEYRGWIYIKDSEESEWKKVIPGRCPQWFLGGHEFIYFLDVGYDGSRSELWKAGNDGENRFRLTKSDYWIEETPVIHKFGKKLAYHFHTCRASGDFHDIVVIDFGKRSADDTADGKVVFRTREYSKFESLMWIDENKLQVIAGGKSIEVDTSVGGLPHTP